MIVIPEVLFRQLNVVIINVHLLIPNVKYFSSFTYTKKINNKIFEKIKKLYVKNKNKKLDFLCLINKRLEKIG